MKGRLDRPGQNENDLIINYIFIDKTIENGDKILFLIILNLISYSLFVVCTFFLFGKLAKTFSKLVCSI
jgi:hypothetical protein